MKGICGILLSLLAVRLVGCAEEKSDSVSSNAPNFKMQLEWLYDISRVSDYAKKIAEEGLNPIIYRLKSPQEYAEIEKIITDAVTKTLELRTLLKMPDSTATPFASADGSVDYSKVATTFIDLIPSLYEKIAELSANADLWVIQKSYYDNTSLITRLNMGDAFRWFKQHGFGDVDKLKEITVDSLNLKLHDICGQDKALKKLATLCATWDVLQDPFSLGDKLAWLLVFSDAVKRTDELAANLKTHIDGLVPEKGEAIVEGIKELSKDHGLLKSFIGKKISGALDPAELPTYSLAKYAEDETETYYKILSRIFKGIEEELKFLQSTVKSAEVIFKTSNEGQLLVGMGFSLEGFTLKGSELAAKIQQLLDKGSAFEKLSELVNEVTKMTSGMHAASISPVALAVLVMSAFAMVA